MIFKIKRHTTEGYLIINEDFTKFTYSFGTEEPKLNKLVALDNWEKYNRPSMDPLVYILSKGIISKDLFLELVEYRRIL